MVDKHHCVQCNTWIQGDRISIRNHEASQRHKERVIANASRRATEKEKAERQEAEAQKELEEVERNARARFAMDMRGRSIAVASDRFDIPIGAGPVLPPPHAEDDDEVPPPPPPRHLKRTPPPPPPRLHNFLQHQQYQHPHYQQEQQYTYQQQQPYQATSHPVVGAYYSLPQAPPPPPTRPPSTVVVQPPPPPCSPPRHIQTPSHPPPQCYAPPPVPPPQLHPAGEPATTDKLEKSKGFYTVRGVVYLEGPAHECELWLDDEENWVPVTITRIFTTTVHDTNEKFKHYHVQRRDIPTAPPIEDVRSDALRIPATMPVGMVVPAERDQTAEFLHQVQQIVSGSTPAAPVKPAAPDYGGWSTVSVRVVDDEAEQAAIEAEAAAFEAKKTQIQIERDNDFLMEESLHADNAMGAFNPWGGRYKGIALDGADPPREDSKDDMAVAPVAFQIKKGGRKPQGKRRVADDA
ncbi:hypothetical protein, variant [Aphanomyces invadans]|uniref:Matrin-type domain-containing protein n=1 Tax=Aphanomyces invadans TaxID=157072 RepID=A0A024U1G9_9STRA|nr:hypothetical protein, variant [Aphanomyces invadans]ETW00276.1 hypothetical protein, variant [Aphanomyces invadans]|eukprot:XP_008871301.1 hypothetical protein, variant [Aphanomyces invadans]